MTQCLQPRERCRYANPANARRAMGEPATVRYSARTQRFSQGTSVLAVSWIHVRSPLPATAIRMRVHDSVLSLPSDPLCPGTRFGQFLRPAVCGAWLRSPIARRVLAPPPGWRSPQKRQPLALGAAPLLSGVPRTERAERQKDNLHVSEPHHSHRLHRQRR